MTHLKPTLQDMFQSFVILLSTDDGHWMTETSKISFKYVIIFIEKECKAKQEKSIIGRKLVLSYIIYKVLKKIHAGVLWNLQSQPVWFYDNLNLEEHLDMCVILHNWVKFSYHNWVILAKLALM